MNEMEFARRVVSTMEALGIPYFITGSIASIALGEPRYTNDIDVVADISLAAVSKILAEFPTPEFYVSESAVRDAVTRKFQFNIIHPSSGLKVDVMHSSNSQQSHCSISSAMRRVTVSMKGLAVADQRSDAKRPSKLFCSQRFELLY